MLSAILELSGDVVALWLAGGKSGYPFHQQILNSCGGASSEFTQQLLQALFAEHLMAEFSASVTPSLKANNRSPAPSVSVSACIRRLQEPQHDGVGLEVFDRPSFRISIGGLCPHSPN